MPTKPKIKSLEPSSLVFRIGIGAMALLFLAIIIFGNMIVTGPGILDSISTYYYSPMRNFFIGSLCVLGTLLICYRYELVDKIAGIGAGLCVISLAICPRTDPSKKAATLTPQEIWIGTAHWAFSIGFLLTIVFIVFYLFTQSDQDPPPKTFADRVFLPFRIADQKNLPKRRRNQIYLGCSFFMILFLILCLVDQVLFSSNLQLESIHPVFCGEIFPLLFFSVAWFVKGLGIWQDANPGARWSTFFTAFVSTNT